MANTVLWILQILAGVLFVLTGSLKLTQSKEKLGASAAWVEDYSAAQLRLIGSAELLGALGLVLPGLTGIMLILTPVAASCLALMMMGAIYTHFRRKEYRKLVLPAVMLLVLLVIAIGRLWILPL
jgi:uncharacterized membrane protein YphA (DoxX/SURF4 family)